MSAKRKDKRGRILKKGESQRQDGSYMFRQTISGKRQTVYAPTLDELREKEESLLIAQHSNIDYLAGNTSVTSLMERHISLKHNIKEHSKIAYRLILKKIKDTPLGSQSIRNVTPSEIKLTLIDFSKNGFSYSTVKGIYMLVKASFETAVMDGAIERNPCSFRLGEVIKKEYRDHIALDQDTQEKMLDYMGSSPYYHKYLDDVIILLHTGLRVGELYGLTLNDIDLTKRKITINKQLCRGEGGKLYIDTPKSHSGFRTIPIDKETVDAFRRVILNRRSVRQEEEIDGVVGFVFLRENGMPRASQNLQAALKNMVIRYNQEHDDQLPNITPHVLRHTYCTAMALSNVDAKSLQYLMGHSDIKTTFNIYTNPTCESIREILERNPQTPYSQWVGA